MRSYEMVVIFKADIEDHKTVSEDTAEIVRGLGAEVEKIDLWGKKRFAYPIDKQLEGFYTLYTFKLDPAQVKEMERLLSLCLLYTSALRVSVVTKEPEREERSKKWRESRDPFDIPAATGGSYSDDMENPGALATAQKTQPVVNDIKIGRNDPCPCGSGKKYKQCCGKNK